MVRDNQNLFAIDYAGWFDKTEALDEFLASVPTRSKFQKLSKKKDHIKEGEENDSDVELIELDALDGFATSIREQNMSSKELIPSATPSDSKVQPAATQIHPSLERDDEENNFEANTVTINYATVNDMGKDERLWFKYHLLYWAAERGFANIVE